MKMKHPIINLLSILLVTITSTTFTASSAAADSQHKSRTTYSQIVIFGDSLSDPGNVFAMTGEVSVRPYNTENIPDAPYPIGGLTFSNGKNWAQLISADLHLNSGKGPALRSPAFTNYAFGGARAAASAGGPFDLSAQVSQYLSNTGGTADSEALYVVYFGGNDIRDALLAFNQALQQTLMSGGSLTQAYAAGQQAAEYTLTDAISTIADNLIVLSAQGARQFLVPNAANLGLVPAIQELGPDTAMLTTSLSHGFNLALEQTLASLEAAFVLKITRSDVFNLITNIVQSPEISGFSNVSEACITPDVYKKAICKKPNEYLFWDGLHPTRAGHRLLAEMALASLRNN